jgi:hypothetical protein
MDSNEACIHGLGIYAPLALPENAPCRAHYKKGSIRES